jgi:hypothetical protein
MREHVHAIASGTIKETDNEIVIAFYGPRGGVRSVQSLSLESAKQLAANLLVAITHIEES